MLRVYFHVNSLRFSKKDPKVRSNELLQGIGPDLLKVDRHCLAVFISIKYSCS